MPSNAASSVREDVATSHTHPTPPIEMDVTDQATAGAHPSDPEGAESNQTTQPFQPTATTSTSPADPMAALTTLPDHPPLTRAQTEALGPALDDDIAAPPPLPDTPAANHTLQINLMLTTGAKHPYNISEKYLTSRNAVAKNTAGDFDPKQLTGYKLKELIWQDWRREWEARPASPSSIRLITMGKMVEDKKVLADYSFALDRSNVVHMTIKPAEFDQDDEAGGKHAGKGSSIRMRDGGEGGAGCRCVIL
ncbi:hypothetical protein LTR78_001986 [Recurvomyces mirabilis]|uniref:UBL3-like ubiquitin domain-containing protein n=1 Tax=Recurvomyces mirabilis TaxID=574656 RepID=A0AAE0WTK8_9PEZI|nr:hypothetical protein LTR78_001986 [Recurvomyces mirabilis]KAK5160444.1 hypothetical protein LTS14_001456 [Recurvomyces mirabilis]